MVLSRLYNVLPHERDLIDLRTFGRFARFSLECLSRFRQVCATNRTCRRRKNVFLPDHREATVSLWSAANCSIQSSVCLFILRYRAYREWIAIPAPSSSATSRHDVSNMLHHARPIEPSRFPRASLGTMTSRSLELLPRTVAARERWSTALIIIINHNSRTETYVNVSQFDDSVWSWLLFAINPTRPVALSPVRSIVLGKIGKKWGVAPIRRNEWLVYYASQHIWQWHLHTSLYIYYISFPSASLICHTDLIRSSENWILCFIVHPNKMLSSRGKLYERRNTTERWMSVSYNRVVSRLSSRFPARFEIRRGRKGHAPFTRISDAFLEFLRYIVVAEKFASYRKAYRPHIFRGGGNGSGSEKKI